MSTVTPTTYAQNERVLCYHGPLMYEAKVLKAEVLETGNAKTGSGGIHYFVHYKGWKQTCVFFVSHISNSNADSVSRVCGSP